MLLFSASPVAACSALIRAASSGRLFEPITVACSLTRGSTISACVMFSVRDDVRAADVPLIDKLLPVSVMARIARLLPVQDQAPVLVIIVYTIMMVTMTSSMTTCIVSPRCNRPGVAQPKRSGARYGIRARGGRNLLLPLYREEVAQLRLQLTPAKCATILNKVA